MSDVPFYMTRGGRTFYEHHVPRLIEAIEKLTEAVEKLAPEKSHDKDEQDA